MKHTVLQNVVEALCDADDPNGQVLRRHITIAEVEDMCSDRPSNVTPVVA